MEKKERLQELLDAARAGEAEAQFELGKVYYYYELTEENQDDALRWMKQAAQGGCAKAQVKMGEIYSQEGWEIEGIIPDYNEMFRWYHMATEQEDPEGEYCLSMCYGSGQGVKQDVEKMMYLTEKSAKAGYAPAQRDMGLRYEGGLGVEKDLKEAEKWYRLASEQGDMWADVYLENLYQTDKEADD